MKDMKPADKAAMLSKATASNPRSGHTAPANGNAGPETKANMASAMGGMPSGGLKGAISELKTQHPFRHDDIATHHGDMSHKRHEPLAGLKPASGKM